MRRRRAGSVGSAAGLMLLCLLRPPVAGAFEADAAPVAAVGTLQAAFTPWDDIEGLLVRVIDGARTQILMQAYLLTSKKIATALIVARHRGIDVEVLADATQRHAPSAKLDWLAAEGVPIWLETRFDNAHNKIIVIDAASPDAVVVTGSFNFTWTAQHKNAENVLIARKNPVLASQFAANWERHRRQATPFRTDNQNTDH